MRATLSCPGPARARAAAAALLLGLAPVVHAARVLDISPRAEVPQVRQARVQFDVPVVPLGDLRGPDPASVSCQPATPAGSGRWEDARTWVYDFREELPPGLRCEVRLKPDWKPGGEPVQGTVAGRFSTGGPAVAEVQPWPGSEIEEDQHFLLQLTGAATEASIAAQAACEIEGVGDRIAVRIVGGADREAVLQAHKRLRAPDRVVVLACTRALPGAAKVRLVWGRGIASKADPQVVTRTEQAFGWRVRAAFSAEFSCERERAQAPCLPIRPLTVRFSAPVPRALAEQVRLTPVAPASGAPRAPALPRGQASDTLSEVSFSAPLADN
ncbi:MAG: alpha-2-macroglobulin, partial [Rubrivivax sp.]